MSSGDPTSSMRMANSSPPSRAAVSRGRRQPARSFATRLSKRSPSPWPRLSLTVLKSSRSMKSTARCEPVRPDAGQGVFESVLEQCFVGQAGQGVVEGPVLELVLQSDAIGDVAEAPDSTDDLVVHRLRPGAQLEGPPVLELEGVEALVLRLGGELLLPRQECLRVQQLVEDEREFGGVVADRHEVRADTPDFREPLVEARDDATGVDGQDSVDGRVESGGEQ